MFLSRERVTQILRTQDPGCFIILFSEAYPGKLNFYLSHYFYTNIGQLEISYVASDKLNASQQNVNLTSSSPGLGICFPFFNSDILKKIYTSQQ
jgi:hypothetical protein